MEKYSGMDFYLMNELVLAKRYFTAEKNSPMLARIYFRTREYEKSLDEYLKIDVFSRSDIRRVMSLVKKLKLSDNLSNKNIETYNEIFNNFRDRKKLKNYVYHSKYKFGRVLSEKDGILKIEFSILKDNIRYIRKEYIDREVWKYLRSDDEKKRINIQNS